MPKYHWITKDGKYGCFFRHGRIYRYSLMKKEDDFKLEISGINSNEIINNE